MNVVYTQLSSGIKTCISLVIINIKVSHRPRLSESMLMVVTAWEPQGLRGRVQGFIRAPPSGRRFQFGEIHQTYTSKSALLSKEAISVKSFNTHTHTPPGTTRTMSILMFLNKQTNKRGFVVKDTKAIQHKR